MRSILISFAVTRHACCTGGLPPVHVAALAWLSGEVTDHAPTAGIRETSRLRDDVFVHTATDLLGSRSHNNGDLTMLVTLLILILILGVAIWAIGLIPMPSPFKTIAYVVVALIVIIFLLQMLPGGGAFRLR